jgi:hypothetical protein
MVVAQHSSSERTLTDSVEAMPLGYVLVAGVAVGEWDRVNYGMSSGNSTPAAHPGEDSRSRRFECDEVGSATHLVDGVEEGS